MKKWKKENKQKYMDDAVPTTSSETKGKRFQGL